MFPFDSCLRYKRKCAFRNSENRRPAAKHKRQYLLSRNRANTQQAVDTMSWGASYRGNDTCETQLYFFPAIFSPHGLTLFHYTFITISPMETGGKTHSTYPQYFPFLHHTIVFTTTKNTYVYISRF